MRLTLPALLFGAASLLSAPLPSAWAQSPLTGTTGPLNSTPPRTSTPPSSAATEPPAAAPSATGEATAPARPHRRRATLAERFAAANTTHDGHLTQEQARAKMPSVARDFAAIDTGNKGYVTLDEIRAHSHARRVAHRAARAAATPADK